MRTHPRVATESYLVMSSVDYSWPLALALSYVPPLGLLLLWLRVRRPPTIRERMRHLSRRLGLLAFLALTFACQRPAFESVPSPIGCYRFDRPVSYSASGDRERGDSAWYVIQLLADSAVRRPYFDPRREGTFAAHSAWRLSADTLRLRVYDGLVGWDMTLLPMRDGYQGRGRYLSDARVVGQEPPSAEFSANRTACNASL